MRDLASLTIVAVGALIPTWLAALVLVNFAYPALTISAVFVAFVAFGWRRSRGRDPRTGPHGRSR